MDQRQKTEMIFCLCVCVYRDRILVGKAQDPQALSASRSEKRWLIELGPLACPLVLVNWRQDVVLDRRGVDLGWTHPHVRQRGNQGARYVSFSSLFEHWLGLCEYIFR